MNFIKAFRELKEGKAISTPGNSMFYVIEDGIFYQRFKENNWKISSFGISSSEIMGEAWEIYDRGASSNQQGSSYENGKKMRGKNESEETRETRKERNDA